MNLFQKAINYIKSSRMELKYVNWPTRKNTLRATLLVIGISASVAIFLGSLDVLFSYILSKFIF